ncbi:hypothetical protein LCGC14_1397280 [marine sediment metagenome]|uniref:Fibronectin type-III domain-containing protein n=1 Tax=marine sediment metagenome TaxID=412755 RepID=A0A0F9MZQ1_9ZZZZ
MAVENFTTYTEVDPNSKITVTSSKTSWATLRRNESAYVYIDKGVNYFGGDFTIYLTYNQTGGVGNSGAGQCWTLANLVNDAQSIITANDDYLSILCTVGVLKAIQLEECDGGTLYYSAADYDITEGTDYYLKIVRDEAVGTYGTLYLYTYSDAARTTLLNTQSITLHSSTKDFRYLYAVQSRNTGESGIYFTGYSENLEVVYNVASTTAPAVTTQAVTNKDKTTATGNGNVTSLGLPLATQYGSCWATHFLPTTDDNKTEDVASPPATGAFTSSLTDLVPSTTYYIRAYVTSSIGTFYGATVTFTTLADVPVMTTNNPTEVATLTALGHGSIDNNGGSAITQHGVCWSTSANPTTADSKTEEGASTTLGNFSSPITVLTAGTLYHVRAYAVNSTGTGYGADVTFTTLVVGVPIVITRATINVRTTTATGVGNINDIGGSAVTQHGHVWSTTINPTTADSKTTLGTGAAGAFASDITVLTDGTTYYVRAYATNSFGTAYGNNDIIYPTSVWGATRGHLIVLGDDHLGWTGRTGKKKAVLGFDI